ncbi:MAG: exo-alpha-sialidase [Lachnospiraceae bacterium]|nr:exo-alpha-sialidase [Lachnospiraceae bacterium]
MKREELGRIILDLKPDLKKGNPRNSEGAFMELENGEIIFIYSRFKGESGADHATSDLAILRSTDGGETFGDEQTVTTCEGEDGVNVMSLSLLEMNDGDIGLFYLVRTTYTMCQMFLKRSSDGGHTWSSRVLCTPYDAFFVVNNDRVTRLANGRILIPAARHEYGWLDAPDSGKIYADSRSEVLFFYSDDDGRTWKQAADKCSIPFHTYNGAGLQEPGLIELADGILWAWARTELGRQYEMFSLDNGEHWTAAQPSRFTSPNSPLSMKRAPGGRIYAIWNPIPEYNGREKTGCFTGGRTPFVIGASDDNGKSFSEPVIFEEDELSGYCYCAIYFTDDKMLLAYCAGGAAEKSCLAKTRLRSIPMEQLRELFPDGSNI